jgi:hypothetical protein
MVATGGSSYSFVLPQDLFSSVLYNLKAMRADCHQQQKEQHL